MYYKDRGKFAASKRDLFFKKQKFGWRKGVGLEYLGTFHYFYFNHTLLTKEHILQESPFKFIVKTSIQILVAIKTQFKQTLNEITKLRLSHKISHNDSSSLFR